MLTSLLNGLVFLLVNGLVVFSSWCLASNLSRQHESLSLRVAATGILSFVHATLVVLFLGVVARYLNAWSVPIMSLLISLTILFLCRNHRQPFIQPLRQSLCQVFCARDYFLYLIVALLVVQVAVLLFKVVWLPPHVWDVFVYHLPPAVEWYQQGFIPPVLDSTVNRINGAPLGMTVLAYWFFIFFRNDFLVEMPMLLWALLLLPVSIAVLRQSGVSRPWALKFAVVIFFIPIVLMQGVTVKDHLGLNIGLVAGLLFLAEFLRGRQYRLLLLAAAAFGLMLGYKIAAPIHILVALLIFSVLLWFRQRSVFVEAGERLLLLKTVGVSAVLIVLISGYWYLRNLIYFGRLQGAYGMRLADSGEQILGHSSVAGAIAAKVGRDNYFYKNLTEFLPRIFDYQNYYIPDLNVMSGYGPQFAAFGLLALIVAISAFFRKELRRQPIYLMSSVAIVLFVMLMFVNYNANGYRILSFFPMILIAYAGVQLYHNGMLQKGATAIAVNSMLILSMLWVGTLLLPPQFTNLMRLQEFVSLDADDRIAANYTRWFVVHRPNFYHLMSEIPEHEPIAHVAYHDILFQNESRPDVWRYLYAGSHWKRKLYSMHLPEYFDCEGTVCRVKATLKTFMQDNNVSLLSSCKINHCLTIRDNDFFEMLPGLYYYRGRP